MALDADAAGDRAAGLLDDLAPFARSVERLRPPAGKDWNGAPLELGFGGAGGMVSGGAAVTTYAQTRAPRRWADVPETLRMRS